jgi:hypothetical protein
MQFRYLANIVLIVSFIASSARIGISDLRNLQKAKMHTPKLVLYAAIRTRNAENKSTKYVEGFNTVV